MKKIISLAIIALLFAATAVAQPGNSDRKLWNLARKTAKTFSKEGWKVDASMPLENMLYKHYQKLKDENNQELIGNVIGNTSVTTVNQGQQWAATMACVSYAKQSRMFVKGRLDSEVGAGVNEGPAADFFYEGYESKVAKEIQGEIKKSFSMYRKNKEGGIDYKAFYVVNEENAHKARLRAMEMMMKESEFARDNADRISKFVNEIFEVNNN